LLIAFAFVVSQAESGEQAYEMLLQQKINLALVDVEMPGMNGFQLLERIKSNPDLEDLPVICTAHNNSST
jgi:CheY-like chemotaxis protein